MKKQSFNWDKFTKTAFYDDSRGHMQKQTRAMQNCFKIKVEGGMGYQKAVEGCLEEFQTSSSNGEWAMKYASTK